MKIMVLQQNIVNDIPLPSKGSPLSAGIDIYSPIDFKLFEGQCERVKLGIAIELNSDEVAIMSERSSMAIKGITSIGNIIDADYRGEISIVLQNNNSLHQEFKKGDKIGQIVVCKLGDNTIEQVEELSETERGGGGFGSSGK